MYGSIASRRNLLVVGTTEASGLLRLFDLRHGRLLRTFEAESLTDCPEIGGVAIDDAWHLHVTNRREHRVHVITPFGREVATYGRPPRRRAGQERRTLQCPNAVAIHASGLVFVACGDRPLVHAVQIFDETLRHRGRLRAFGENEEAFSAPRGIRAAGERVWVADTGNGCIHTFSIRGTFLSVISTAVERGERSRPVDVLPARAPGDGLLVAQVGEESAIKEFDREGRFVRYWARTGDGTGEVLDPSSMAWDAHGRLLVLDELGLRVQVFEDGRFTHTFLDERPCDVQPDHEASSRR